MATPAMGRFLTLPARAGSAGGERWWRLTGWLLASGEPPGEAVASESPSPSPAAGEPSSPKPEPPARRRSPSLLAVLWNLVAIAAIALAVWLGWQTLILTAQLEAVGVGGEALQARTLFIAHLSLENMKQAVAQKNFGDALKEVATLRAALLLAGQLEVDTGNANGLLLQVEESLANPTPQTPQTLQELDKLIERISPRRFESFQQELTTPAAPPSASQPAVPPSPAASPPTVQPQPVPAAPSAAP